jgi:cyclopropane-fatty-acyl-phospholipid synthase
MRDTSVRFIKLPGLRSPWTRESMARSALRSVLARLKVGSLTIHEGDETVHYGNVAAAEGPHAVAYVHDPAVYSRVLLGGSVGSGESYMLGHWSSPNLVEVIRLFCANMAVLDSMDSGVSVIMRRLGAKLAHMLNANSLSGSRRNIAAHYDLGNDFFSLFLDPTMMYSSAVFPRPDAGLHEASEHKLELICQSLELSPQDHLLEIGTGWGGMAVHAASRYGCRVTTTTLSQEQYDYTVQRVSEAGLGEQVTVLCKDYRDLEGQFDKLVSIEMIEAVGYQYYQSYFSKCSALLKPGGLMTLQAITMADQRYEEAKLTVDFIKRYIFPGGCLPSLAVIGQHVAQDTDMQMVQLRDITLDYAETLAQWRQRFMDALPQVREQDFDELFERMWEFYLCYCEGGFRERVIGTVQLTLAKPGYRASLGA